MSLIVTKKINVQGSVFPLTYAVLPVQKDCEYKEYNVQTCFTVLNPTGTLNTSQVVEIQIQLFESDCLDCWTFDFIVTDAQQCSSKINFSIDGDPCETFDVSAIQTTPFLDFYIIAVGGQGPLTYQWQWNAPNLIALGGSQNTSHLNLELSGPYVPNQILQVTVTVTDSKGCAVVRTTSFPICRPTALNIETSSYCVPGNRNTFFTPKLNLPVFFCDDCPQGQEIQFFVDLPSNKFTFNNDGSISLKELVDTDFLNNNLLVIPYYFIDNCGRQSSTGYIVVSKGSCVDAEICEIYFPVHICLKKACDEECLSVDLDDWYIYPLEECENEIDWSTLEIVSEPEAPATVEIDLGNHIITYCPNSAERDVDSFKFKLSDFAGNSSGEILVTIALGVCSDPPILEPDTYEVCKNSSNNEFEVLINDTPPLNAASLNIITPPTNGTAFVSNGKIYYTPNNNYTGSDSLEYEVANPNGVYSSTTVTITVVNTGNAGGNNVINFA